MPPALSDSRSQPADTSRSPLRAGGAGEEPTGADTEAAIRPVERDRDPTEELTMTNPYISKSDGPAVYHGPPSPYSVFSDRDIERRLNEHGEQCEKENCPMLRHLQKLRAERTARAMKLEN